MRTNGKPKYFSVMERIYRRGTYLEGGYKIEKNAMELVEKFEKKIREKEVQ